MIAGAKSEAAAANVTTVDHPVEEMKAAVPKEDASLEWLFGGTRRALGSSSPTMGAMTCSATSLASPMASA